MNKNEWVIFNDELIQAKDVRIDPLSSSIQYGLNVFEGMRVYCEENNKFIVAAPSRLFGLGPLVFRTF